MFTVKVYAIDSETVDFYECEGVRRQFIAGGDVELTIKHKLADAGSWLHLRLRDMSSQSVENRKKLGAPDGDPWTYAANAIVENAAGKTTEIIYPNICPDMTTIFKAV